MDYSDNNVKHLEFIQSNISRMNQCSFQMKGWMITIVAALLAIYVSSINKESVNGNPFYLLVAAVPTFLFWLLDSYYLQQERKFRGLYNDVVKGSSEINAFEMVLDKYSGCKYCLFPIMFSKSEVVLYLPTIIALIVGFFALKNN